MQMLKGTDQAERRKLLQSGPLTEERAREIVAQGHEAAVFVILALSKSLSVSDFGIE